MLFRHEIRRGIDRAWFAVTLESARRAADDPQFVGGRLTSGNRNVASLIAAMFPRPSTDSDRLDLASALQKAGHRLGGVDEQRGTGIAFLLTGDPERAAAAFEGASETRGDASFWNDLAAAETLAFARTQQDRRWLQALVATDHALALDAQFAPALFNRALLIESLGVASAARRQWTSYLALDATSPWAVVARRHLHPRPTRADTWKSELAKLATFSPADFDRLTRHFPQEARSYGEGVFLSAWAEAAEHGETAAATRYLGIARSFGQSLRRTTGESLLADAVAAIERSPANNDLVKGHLIYREGRLNLRDGDLAWAEPKLRNAARLFERAGSPMAAVAQVYAASVLVETDRSPEALAMLTPLLATERPSGASHKALIARILHEIALCEAVRGHWSDSLAAAGESATISRALGEDGNAAAAEAILSEDYDFLGKPQLARRFGLHALRSAGESDDLFRARVILASLSRTEAREGWWEGVLAVIGLEASLAPAWPDRRLDTDMYFRKAAAQSRLDRRKEAADALSQARSSAAKVPDAATRLRLLSYIDGVDGAISRRSNPRRAISLLSSAIAFQQRATRPILLPELYLERGRARVDLNDLAVAERDFDDGIRELERQRDGVHEAELRPGIFDDAAELFQQAVLLQLRRKANPSLALAYAERGRARTVIEQIEGAATVPAPAIAEVQRGIAAGTALVEYVSLPDRIAAFVISTDAVVLRIIPISRGQASAAVTSFMDALTSNHEDAAGMLALSGSLYDVLVGPLERDLAGKSAITFIGDGDLQRLPFAALFDRRSRRYLIERYAITTAPSATVFLLATLKYDALHRSVPVTAIVFANPTAPQNLFPDLPPLDAAESEVKIVARSYPQSTSFIRTDATAQRFMTLASSYDVVQFSGHAIVQRNEPASSALICAESPDAPGPLTSRDIARMHFRSTQAVLLAACSTMTGRQAAVEGMSSLAQAFLIAGVPAVLGTLWDIEDEDAVPIMTAVHDRMAHGVSLSEAVRSAQIKAIRSSSTYARSPNRWAAFAVMGVNASASPAPR